MYTIHYINLIHVYVINIVSSCSHYLNYLSYTPCSCHTTPTHNTLSQPNKVRAAVWCRHVRRYDRLSALSFLEHFSTFFTNIFFDSKWLSDQQSHFWCISLKPSGDSFHIAHTHHSGCKCVSDPK